MKEVFSLDDDVKWIRITYLDKSQRIIRATRCVDLILKIRGSLEDRDVYYPDGRGVIRPNYVFDVKYERFIEVENLKVGEFENKPKYEREVDKFASRFL